MHEPGPKAGAGGFRQHVSGPVRVRDGPRPRGDGRACSPASGREGVAEDALARLHEIYRLRVELELETAGVLWRTAEVVCALTDALTAIAERDRGPGGGARALLGAEDRRARAGIPPRGPLAGRPELAVVDGVRRAQARRRPRLLAPPEPTRPRRVSASGLKRPVRSGPERAGTLNSRRAHALPRLKRRR